MAHPTGIETVTQGTSGWVITYNANFEKLRTDLEGPLVADNALGSQQVADITPAQTSNGLTDNSTGSDTGSIEPVADSATNNNFKSLVTDYNKLKTEVDNTFAKVNELLPVLRKTGGCGVLDD